MKYFSPLPNKLQGAGLGLILIIFLTLGSLFFPRDHPETSPGAVVLITHGPTSVTGIPTIPSKKWWVKHQPSETSAIDACPVKAAVSMATGNYVYLSTVPPS